MDTTQKIFLENYQKYSDEIFRFIFFKLSDREKAKDLLQDVFMKMWIYTSKNNSIDNVRAFLYKSAGNAVIDTYRRQERQDNKLSSLEALAEESGFDPGFEELDTVIDRIDGKQALELLKELPENYAEVIFLRYVENKSISEIAEIFGKSNNVVSVQLSRGLGKLKQIMKEKFKSQSDE